MHKSKIHNVAISVVIPCFNEEGNIEPMHRALSGELRPYGRYEILFVDDGSTDGSLALLQQLTAADSSVGYLRLSRNFGHQQALKAGLDRARGDCVITMDADLQHEPALIHTLICCWHEEGYQVVYTLRDDAGQKNMKSRSSALFYRLLNRLSETRVEPGSADFRLLDRVVVEELKKTKEHHLFLRGLIPWMGFRQTGSWPKQVFAGKNAKTGILWYYFLQRDTTTMVVGLGNMFCSACLWLRIICTLHLLLYRSGDNGMDFNNC